MKERKVYMTVDRNGNPVKFGNGRKFAWTSDRWVRYHIKPYWRNPSNPSSFVQHGGKVKIIDLKTDTIEVLTAASFLIRYGGEDDFKAEAKQKIGFSIEPGVLVEMYKSQIFQPVQQVKIEEFLKEKNLI